MIIDETSRHSGCGTMLYYRIRAVSAPAAVFAACATPYGVKMFRSGIYQCCIG